MDSQLIIAFSLFAITNLIWLWIFYNNIDKIEYLRRTIEIKDKTIKELSLARSRTLVILKKNKLYAIYCLEDNKILEFHEEKETAKLRIRYLKGEKPNRYTHVIEKILER